MWHFWEIYWQKVSSQWEPDIGPAAHEVNLVILSELIMGTGLYIGATLFIVNLGKPRHWTTNYFKW